MRCLAMVFLLDAQCSMDSFQIHRSTYWMNEWMICRLDYNVSHNSVSMVSRVDTWNTLQNNPQDVGLVKKINDYSGLISWKSPSCITNTLSTTQSTNTLIRIGIILTGSSVTVLKFYFRSFLTPLNPATLNLL